MGLDMYLTAKRYFLREETAVAECIKSHSDLDLGGMELKEIVCCAAYWRNADAIHRWFVNRLQDGEDDGEEYEVSVEQLQELAAWCDEMLGEYRKQVEKASDLDAVQQHYLSCLQYTKAVIEKLMRMDGLDDWGFYYQAGW